MSVSKVNKVNKQRWWRPNLFMNGDFSKNATQFPYYLTGGDLGGSCQIISDLDAPVGNKAIVLSYKANTTYTKSDPKKASRTFDYIHFRKKMTFKKNETYTFSWWEKHTGHQMIYPRSYISFHAENNDPNSLGPTINSETISLDYASIANGKYNKVSVTVKMPSNPQCVYFVLNLGLHLENLHSGAKSYYSGIYVCKGEETPYHWIDEESCIDTHEDYLYWKTLDDNNRIYAEQPKSLWSEVL